MHQSLTHVAEVRCFTSISTMIVCCFKISEILTQHSATEGLFPYVLTCVQISQICHILMQDFHWSYLILRICFAMSEKQRLQIYTEG